MQTEPGATAQAADLTMFADAEPGSDLLRLMDNALAEVSRLQRALERGQHVEQELDIALAKYHQYRATVRASEAPWLSVQMARSRARPNVDDCWTYLFDSAQKIGGLRGAKPDPALRLGLVRLGGYRAVFAGIAKGRSPEDQLTSNFGMVGPRGFRSFQQAVALAVRRNYPVITFVDTPGALPSIESEEAGIAESIARAFLCMAEAPVPTIAIIAGEGGSGGALALALSDHMVIFEKAYFSVISPEACASILYRDGTRAKEAAERLGLSSYDLQREGLVDDVYPEEPDFAHIHPRETLCGLRNYLIDTLQKLEAMPQQERLERRYAKYRNMGRYSEVVA